MSLTETMKDIKKRLRLPVMAAPMFLVSGPDMVVACCKAGILGSLPGPNGRSIEDLRSWFEIITEGVTTADAPWAFNMITHSSYGRFDAELDLVREYQPSIVISALGGPHRVTDAVHSYGGLVFADVNSPTFAKKALDKGADGLVLVCSGAGGHTGEYAMLPFVEDVRSYFDGPIIVGGGVGTGKAVRAVETLGADIVNVGTRFLAAKENLVSEAYRKMVIDSHMEDLVASRAITGALGLWLKASVEAAGLDTNTLAADTKIDFSGDMHEGSKAWKNVWSAGQGLGAVTKSESVADIVNTLVADYNQTIVDARVQADYVQSLKEAS